MIDPDRDGNTIPLDFYLGYAAGLEHGQVDAREGKPRTPPTGEGGVWWHGYRNGYTNGYTQQSRDIPPTKTDILRAAGYPNLPAYPCPPVEDFLGLPVVNTPADKLFQVIEYFSFFAVRHLPTGAECLMGDGVDALDCHSEKVGPLLDRVEAGELDVQQFLAGWEQALNADPLSTLETYFPELVDQPEEDEEEEPA